MHMCACVFYISNVYMQRNRGLYKYNNYKNKQLSEMMNEYKYYTGRRKNYVVSWF